MKKISSSEHQYVANFIKKKLGTIIPKEKAYLIEQRLGPLLEEFSCSSYMELVNRLNKISNDVLYHKFVDAITTHETSFFRDPHVYKGIQEQILPELINNIRSRRSSIPNLKLDIWSAASSTGQEPYTLAMILLESVHKHKSMGLKASDFSILATDIAEHTLEVAKAGRFSDLDIKRGLCTELKERYFDKQDGYWEAKDELKKLITFQIFNLLEPFKSPRLFDLIMCRNVLIYFDQKTSTEILIRFKKHLRPGGYLILGAAEMVDELATGLKIIPSKSIRVYQS